VQQVWWENFCWRHEWCWHWDYH